MEIHVTWDIANFTAINSNFICQHTWGWDLDRVGPVVVVVAEGVRKVENCVFGYFRIVCCNIEMGWLNCSLSNGMRHQEEIEASILNSGLLNKALIDIGTLRRVGNLGILAGLEESLSNTLVDNDQGMLWKLSLWDVTTIFCNNNLVKLLKLVADDLGSHGVSDTISIDENVIWKRTVVVVSESLESTLEVFLKYTRADDLLALLALGTCLGVVLAHVLIISCAESNDALFTFMTNIDSNKHGLAGDFGTELKTPEVST